MREQAKNIFICACIPLTALVLFTLGNASPEFWSAFSMVRLHVLKATADVLKVFSPVALGVIVAWIISMLRSSSDQKSRNAALLCGIVSGASVMMLFWDAHVVISTFAMITLFISAMATRDDISRLGFAPKWYMIPLVFIIVSAYMINLAEIRKANNFKEIHEPIKMSHKMSATEAQALDIKLSQYASQVTQKNRRELRLWTLNEGRTVDPIMKGGSRMEMASPYMPEMFICEKSDENVKVSVKHGEVSAITKSYLLRLCIARSSEY